jgi:hypothetical protein
MYVKKTKHRGQGRVSKITMLQAERAVARIRNGESATQVAAEYGVATETLRLILRGKVTRLRDGLSRIAA